MTTLLYTAAQVRALDRAAIEHGTPGYTLMQRAAEAAWRTLRRRWPLARRIVVLCGPGNNGGDGYLVAKLARAAGLGVTAIALAPPAAESDAARACADWRAAGGDVEAPTTLPPADVYVDALFGTGLSRPLEGEARTLIERVNALGSPVLAIDVPSGLDADTGAVLGAAVRASATITFVAHKRGLFTGDALDHCGELALDTLGVAHVYDAVAADAQLLDLRSMMSWLPRRPRNAHKGLYGHVLAIGGEHGMGGAIRLAGEAALRVGAGLVSVATRGEHVVALNAARPELMAHAVADATALARMIERATVVALGPGLGTGDWSRTLWQAALDAGKPCVVDADGLNLLAAAPRALPHAAILTPHPGEAARLADTTTAEVGRDRFAAARALARRYAAVVVLKGAGTLIAAPSGELAVCP